MHVNAEEFRNEFEKYIELAQFEDILIVEQGKFVARVSGSVMEKRRMLDEITGSVAFDGDPEEIFKGRLDEL